MPEEVVAPEEVVTPEEIPEVLGVEIVRAPAQPSSEVLGVQTTRSGQLPRTGSELTNVLTLSGIALLAGGLLLVTQSRPRRKAVMTV